MNDKYADQGLVMIGMNADDLPRDEFLADLESKSVNWRQGMMGIDDHPVYDDYDIDGYPTKFVIDREGKLVAIDPTDLEACIASVL